MDKEIFSTGDEILKRPINAQSSHNLMNAYLTIGVLSSIIWLIFTITYLYKRSNKPHESRDNKVKIVSLADVNDKNNNENSLNELGILSSKSRIKPHHKIIMILLAAMFTHGIYGVEISYGNANKLSFKKLKITKI